MSRRRAIASAVLLALVCALVQSSVAGAEFRGTDMWSNIMPSGSDGLVNRYPISHYQLDYHVDGPSIGLTGPDAGDIGGTIAQFMASFLFLIGAMLMRCVIAIFDWSNNIDLITGANGGLAHSAPIVQNNYQSLVTPFFTVAIICLGAWVAHKAIKHQQNDLMSVVVRAVVLTVVALAIVNHPQDTIGRVYQMGDDIAMTIINGGDGSSVSDRMFETFIYRPHAVLQHGGLEVCTGAKLDDDGFPLAATSQNPARECHSVLKRDPDGHGNYEAIMLRYAPGSKERKEYYDALREGKEFADAPTARIDKTDAPAVDMMQAGGALQRLVFVILIMLGMAGGILLLGLIVIARMFSQIALLFLYFASPFVILAAVYPGSHGIAMKYMSLVGKVLVSSVVFALLLSITLNTSRGLALAANAASPTAGYGVAFGLQAILFLGVFFKRKAILEKVTSSKTAHNLSESENRTKAFVATAAVGTASAVSGGVGGIAGTMREGWKSGHGSDHSSSASEDHKPDSTSPPASAGRTHSPVPVPSDNADHAPSTSVTNGRAPSNTDVPSTTSATMSEKPQAQESQMPTKSFREELADTRARRYDESSTMQTGVRDEDGAAAAPAPPVVASPVGSSPTRPTTPPSDITGSASASSFEWDLEEMRRERELERRE